MNKKMRNIISILITILLLIFFIGDNYINYSKGLRIAVLVVYMIWAIPDLIITLKEVIIMIKARKKDKQGD